MPYPGIPEEKTADMESCVTKVMSEGKSKEQAIAICHDSIMGNETHGIKLTPVDEADLQRWGHPVIAENRAELLKAHDVVLARAERNANGDGITSDNINELASTLALKPLDLDHKQDKVIGMFFNPRAKDNSLVADMLLYASRFPDACNEIQAGTRKPSIEAVSHQVKCSICDRWLDKPTDYCEHLMPLLMGSRLADNVTRYHRNMRATGGGAVLIPAGTDTTFGSQFVTVAHVVGEPVQEEKASENQEGQMSEVNVEQIQAELEETKNALSAKQARVEELEAEVELHKASAAKALGKARETVLAAAGMPEGRIEMLADRLAAMDEIVFETLVKMQGEHTTGADKKPKENKTEADEKPAEQIHVGDEDNSATPDVFAALDIKKEG